jgi:5-methylthioadenosine/S-adenosylhomocysteine deaminase
MYHPISHLVYAANGSDVTHAIISGRVVMENRQIRSLDLHQVMADVNEIAKRIRP